MNADTLLSVYHKPGCVTYASLVLLIALLAISAPGLIKTGLPGIICGLGILAIAAMIASPLWFKSKPLLQITKEGFSIRAPYRGKTEYFAFEAIKKVSFSNFIKTYLGFTISNNLALTINLHSGGVKTKSIGSTDTDPQHIADTLGSALRNYQQSHR